MKVTTPAADESRDARRAFFRPWLVRLVAAGAVVLGSVVVAFVIAFAQSALAQPSGSPPGVEEAKGLAGVIASGGGWGLSAILMIGMVFLHRKNEALTDRIIGLVEKQSAVLTEHNLSVKRQIDLFERFMDGAARK